MRKSQLPFLLFNVLLLPTMHCAPILAASTNDRGGPWLLESPNRRVAIEVAWATQNSLTYRVLLGAVGNRREVIAPSRLGVERDDAPFTNNLRFVSERSREINERYTLVRGKHRNVEAHAVERTLVLAASSGGRMEIDLRAYDEGVAFRYRFPERSDETNTIVAEATEVAVPATARGFLLPHDEPSRWAPAYEAPWLADVPAGTPAPKKAGWALPALFKIPRAAGHADWVLVADVAVDASYAAVRFEPDAPGGRYRVRFPDPAEDNAQDPVLPSWVLPWTLPWRAFIVAENVGRIVESDLVTHLAPPSRIEDTSWIQPGRASWSWWSGGTGGMERLASYVEFAEEMGWEYSLLDGGWNRLSNEDLTALIQKARDQKVKLLVWYNSGTRSGGRGGSTMREGESRRAEFQRIAALGMAGVKVDFFDSDKQRTMREYLEILQDAADARLVVNFHGATAPKGWERTWPNLLSMEAVRGTEAYRSDEDFPRAALTHNLILPFTRNVVGPMDYTPVALTKTKCPRLTTVGHELASAAVFESGIVHFCDSVESYRALPEGVKDLMRTLPAAWDEIRFVEGEPGRYVVLARRLGRTWWLAGMSGEEAPRKIRVPLAFLDHGRYATSVARDGSNDTFVVDSSTSKAGGIFSVEMAIHGGFLARFRPGP